jgi:Transcriptional Coactivator p15 (PC4)
VTTPPPRGDLEQLEERVLVELPRGPGGREALRLRFVRARTPDGKEVAWHDLREFWRGDDAQWHPGRKGISIRGRELGPVAVAFLRAVASSVPPDLYASAKAIVAALEAKAPATRAPMPDEEYRQRRGQVPR